MITCVLNAAEGQLDIVLGQDDHMLCSQRWYMPHRATGGMGGAEILTPALHSLCSLVNIAPQDIARWACVHGPGSFTGIRLVLGTVAAIRRITDARNAPLNFMHCLATTAQQRGHALSGTKNLTYWVLTHARRNLVHCAIYQYGDDIPTPYAPVILSSPEEVATRMLESTTPAVVLGSGLERNRDVLARALSAHLYPHGLIVPVSCVSPEACALWELAKHVDYANQDVEPLYIRECDAVENLSHIARKHGIDPRIAEERLQQLLS